MSTSDPSSGLVAKLAARTIWEPTTPEGEAAACDLRVGGMDCASCAASIERSLKTLGGVRDVRVDLVGGKVRVAYAAGSHARDEFAGAIRRAGFSVQGEPSTDRPAAPGSQTAPAGSFWSRRGRLILAAAAGIALGLALGVERLGASAALVIALLALSTVAGGWYVVPRGLRAVRSGALDMNFLMATAAAGAWMIGEQGEAAATLFLFAVAEFLESYSMERARNAIKALMELSPLEARVVRDGQEVQLPVAEIAVGEYVIVRPGEKVPVDGVVEEGRSSVNQAPITGESMPVDKEPGSEVFAATLNGQGVLTVRSTKPASDSTLARIIHAVEEAQASRAPSQTFVDRFARVYTPAVVVAAVLLAVVPPLAGGGDWNVWIYRALAMLVVACPCALVISTPVSIVSGLAGAARVGILIKGGAFLERAATTATVAFDKTGTLTEGKPAVTDLVALDGVAEDEVLRLALGVERHSEHPLAQAVIEHGRGRGASPPPSSEFEALVGRGARARVGDTVVFIGNERLGRELELPAGSSADLLQRFEHAGKTAVLVIRARAGSHAEAIGVIAIADRIRSDAAAALADLRAAGIRRIVMLTGDNAGTARAVAAQLGVDYQAELLPDDKVRIVKDLQSGGGRVAFVGDGVNDAPALAVADLGVAMGAAGTDVALETADVALMGDDLSKLATTIRFARKTVRIIKQNIAVSILIKALFLILVVGGWATLWMAVAADMGGSLLVVANGMRALRE